MEITTLIVGGVVVLLVGIFSGYQMRKIVIRRKEGTIEEKLESKIKQAQQKGKKILQQAQNKIAKSRSRLKKKVQQREKELNKTRQLLLKKEDNLEKKEDKIKRGQNKIAEKKEELKEKKNKIVEQLEEVASLSQAEARHRLLNQVGEKYEQALLGRMKKLEEQGLERYEKEAQQIIATAIQKYSLSQVEDLTTSTISLPNEDMKGKIIGKNGRNIKAFEKMTGAEVMVDEAPETVVLSCYDPIRRRVAQVALEKLIQDGRIQPARIERTVQETKQQVKKQIKKAGESAVYETGVVDLPSKLIELLGRLHFRTSYGQNMLLHSMEVAWLAATMAAEIGVNSKVAKKAGLLHDIGKAVDQEIEGSHVEIGIKILKRFDIKPEVITAMKSHHEDYPYESVEAMLVQAADAISGARPGARKENAEEFIERLDGLEQIAQSINGVEDCYAVEAGREIRVFVKPEQVSDLEAQRIAQKIADEVQRQLTYPGEIKVNVIREKRMVEYAR